MAASSQMRAYEAIRRWILRGELAPEAPLSETQLAVQLELSRTPVREALKRLEHEGLVRSFPHRGTFVTAVSVQDILEIYQIREELEGMAARVAAEQMPSEASAALAAELDRAAAFVGEPFALEAAEGDRLFHRGVVDATRNSRLGSLLATIDDQMHRIRVISSRSAPWVAGTLVEHRRILECIVARDPQGAEALMRRHLQLARENAIRLVTPTTAVHRSAPR
jgi:DNA-binding GntR family transcriptional regulator